jgi:hypothetical protein
MNHCSLLDLPEEPAGQATAALMMAQVSLDLALLLLSPPVPYLMPDYLLHQRVQASVLSPPHFLLGAAGVCCGRHRRRCSCWMYTPVYCSSMAAATGDGVRLS